MSEMKTPDTIAQRFNEIKQEIAAKAFSDSTFRESLLADPRTTIVSEYGLPDEALKSLKINILEEQPGTLTIPIPPNIEDVELSDEQLELVSGGLTPMAWILLFPAAASAGGITIAVVETTSW